MIATPTLRRLALAAALLCVAATVIPLRVALRRLEQGER